MNAHITRINEARDALVAKLDAHLAGEAVDLTEAAISFKRALCEGVLPATQRKIERGVDTVLWFSHPEHAAYQGYILITINALVAYAICDISAYTMSDLETA